MPIISSSSKRRRTAKPVRTKTDARLMARANRRAIHLIEMLLARLESGVAEECDGKASAHWQRLFGTTQSAVMNVQKLVAALGALPSVEEVGESAEEALPEVPMTREELMMLIEWLDLGDR